MPGQLVALHQQLARQLAPPVIELRQSGLEQSKLLQRALTHPSRGRSQVRGRKGFGCEGWFVAARRGQRHVQFTRAAAEEFRPGEIWTDDLGVGCARGRRQCLDPVEVPSELL